MPEVPKPLTVSASFFAAAVGELELVYGPKLMDPPAVMRQVMDKLAEAQALFATLNPDPNRLPPPGEVAG